MFLLTLSLGPHVLCHLDHPLRFYVVCSSLPKTTWSQSPASIMKRQLSSTLRHILKLKARFWLKAACSVTSSSRFRTLRSPSSSQNRESSSPVRIPPSRWRPCRSANIQHCRPCPKLPAPLTARYLPKPSLRLLLQHPKMTHCRS